MVLATVTVTWVGFFKYKIGIKNSKTYFCLPSRQSLMVYPSLEWAAFLNFPIVNLSVWEANPDSFLGNLYTFAQTSFVQVPSHPLTVSSYWFEAPMMSSWIIWSFFIVHGLRNGPTYPIVLRSSSNYDWSLSLSGMVRQTIRVVTNGLRISPSAIVDQNWLNSWNNH